MFRLTILFCLFWTVACFGQKDSIIVDRTLDGVHKKSMCDVDTMVTFHSAKSFFISDSTELTYEFRSGSKNYVEIRLRSSICSCKDCSFADHLSIDITGLEPGDQLTLNSDNTTWIHWNSLMMVNREDSFKGTFTYLGSGQFTLEVFKYLPAQPQVKYDGIKVASL